MGGVREWGEWNLVGVLLESFAVARALWYNTHLFYSGVRDVKSRDCEVSLAGINQIQRREKQ